MTNSELTAALAGVRLVAMDVDGTYTDGILLYSPLGEVSKAFDAHDGFALELLRLMEISRGFITGRKDGSTRVRGEYLRLDFILDDIADKGKALRELLTEFDIPKAACLFIGDDLNDLEAFDAAGVRVAVANAVDAVKRRADIVTTRSGGNGAVREVVQMIVAAKGLDEETIWRNRRDTVIGSQ